MRKFQWMTDDNFFDKQTFNDKFYLKSVFKHIFKYVTLRCPVPLLVHWNDPKRLIVFELGELNKLELKVSSNVYVKDYVYVLKKWVSNFLIEYSVGEDVNRELTPQEIANKIDDSKSINDLLNLTVSDKKYYKGKLVGINLRSDEIHIEENGIIRIYTCKIPVSFFLKDIRTLKKDEEIRNYILDNTIHVKDIEKSLEPIKINLSNEQSVINFFQNRFKYEPESSLNPTNEENWYSWGSYLIYMESPYLIETCETILRRHDTNSVIEHKNIIGEIR